MYGNTGVFTQVPRTGGVNDEASYGSPSTPTTRPNAVIDPRLLETPDLDRSTLTQSSPPDPQTPDAPGVGRSCQRALSPLSDVSDGDTATVTEKTQSLKRKRPASNADRPKTRAKRKATRA